MTLNTLFDNFELLADASNGVQKLRELILQLAVRGKLVLQDPNDERASVLLERIREEKQRQNGQQRLWRTEPQPVEDVPYELPAGWEWTYLSEITTFDLGRTPLTKVAQFWDNDGIPWVSIGDMVHYETIIETARRVSQRAASEVFQNKIVPVGTLLMSFKLTIGKVSILGMDAFHNEAIISIFPAAGVSQSFLFRFLPVFAMQGKTNNAIKGNTLNSETLKRLLIPLPPTAEQRRIVAKVDHLMALCDELEARQQQRREARTRLNDAALDHLLTARDANEFSAHWQRLRDHFDLLYDTPETVGRLRQAILQLAVQGKLVPQDPNDEPASMLLEKIREEKERQNGQQKLWRTEPQPVEDVPYELPQGWTWTKAQDVFLVITDGDHQPPPKTDLGIPFLVISNVRTNTLDFTNTRFVPPSYYQSLDESRKPGKGDILYTVTGSYGVPVIVDTERPFCVQRHIAILKPSKLVEVVYLYYVLKSNLVFDQATRCATGIAQKTVPLNGLRKIVLPLPPTNEQRRIVAKVDQLMALCDELEARLKDAQEGSAALLHAVVREVLAENVTAA